MTSALDMCRAARQAWERSQPQLFFELETSPLAGNYGSPDALLATLQARGVNPGASTHPASTDGRPLPPVEAVPFPHGEERGAGLNQTASTRSTSRPNTGGGMEVTS